MFVKPSRTTSALGAVFEVNLNKSGRLFLSRRVRNCTRANIKSIFDMKKEKKELGPNNKYLRNLLSLKKREYESSESLLDEVRGKLAG